MAQQTSDSSSSTLYPQLESTVDPLEESEFYSRIIKREKDFIAHFRQLVATGDPLKDLNDTSIFPAELITNQTKKSRIKVDPLKRLKELPTEDQEDEEESVDEEEADELVEDEEDDAGGDYIVSHFDNGEGFDENDEDGDDMTSMI